MCYSTNLKKSPDLITKNIFGDSGFIAMTIAMELCYFIIMSRNSLFSQEKNSIRKSIQLFDNWEHIQIFSIYYSTKLLRTSFNLSNGFFVSKSKNYQCLNLHITNAQLDLRSSFSRICLTPRTSRDSLSLLLKQKSKMMIFNWIMYRKIFSHKY